MNSLMKFSYSVTNAIANDFPWLRSTNSINFYFTFCCVIVWHCTRYAIFSMRSTEVKTRPSDCDSSFNSSDSHWSKCSINISPSAAMIRKFSLLGWLCSYDCVGMIVSPWIISRNPPRVNSWPNNYFVNGRILSVVRSFLPNIVPRLLHMFS